MLDGAHFIGGGVFFSAAIGTEGGEVVSAHEDAGSFVQQGCTEASVEVPGEAVFQRGEDLAVPEAVAVDYSKISAYDMMTLEDIPLSDFLLRSPSNIVIKVREQYYAFDRKMLVDYMVGKRVFVSDWVEIFETPYRQYLSGANMNLIRSDVFRIYELCDESSVPFRGGMVSIYDVKAFTVKMWIEA